MHTCVHACSMWACCVYVCALCMLCLCICVCACVCICVHMYVCVHMCVYSYQVEIIKVCNCTLFGNKNFDSIQYIITPEVWSCINRTFSI